MATTIATVTPDGFLALPQDVMAELNLKPGSRITVTLSGRPSQVPHDIDRLIRETQGMFATSGGGMAEELVEQRREEERRYQAKKW